MVSRGRVCYVSRWQQRFAFHFHVCHCVDVFLSGEAMGQEVPWFVGRNRVGMGLSILVDTPLHPGQCCTGTRGDGGRKYNSPLLYV